MSDKKKVYVETTVVSDATALPTRDLVQAGRQLVTREWWNNAAKRFDLFSSNVVSSEARRGDSTLEEMWQIKREIAAEYPSLEAYFKGFLAEQADRERRGVKFVHFEPQRVESAMT